MIKHKATFGNLHFMVKYIHSSIVLFTASLSSLAWIVANIKKPMISIALARGIDVVLLLIMFISVMRLLQKM